MADLTGVLNEISRLKTDIHCRRQTDLNQIVRALRHIEEELATLCRLIAADGTIVHQLTKQQIEEDIRKLEASEG